jgi:protein-S-isoprenylcysteine O-methyltransferase Ste14
MSRAPGWAVAMRRLTTHLSEDFLGGPRPWTLAWVINAQKAGTFAFVGLCMWWYDNTSAAAWTYLALHGSYGLVWLLKDVAFPDPRWRTRVTIGGGLMSFLLVLGPYWLIAWLLIAGVSVPRYPLPDAAWFALCTTLCVLGCVTMIAADAQKYFTLRARPGLIVDGMHRYVRHPNYLGEMMVYGSFALLVWHWLPVVILAWVWVGVFSVNMIMKEASLSRFPEWTAYRARTRWVVPFLLSLALLPVACTDPSGPEGASDVVSVVVDSTSLPLVKQVTVVMRTPAPLRLTWGAPGTPVLTRTADSSAFIHRLLLPRLRPNKAYVVEAKALTGSGAVRTADFTTDTLPTVIRSIAINQTGTPSLPVALIEVVGATQFAGLLMIEDGQVVGWLPTVGSLFGATRRANGNIVTLEAASGLVERTLGGTTVHTLPQPTPAAPLPYGTIHHDVIPTPANTLYFIAMETRYVAPDSVVGESIWEWSPETGAVTKRWSAFDFLDWSTLRGARSVPGNWLHGNGLSIGPRNNVVMSLRNADQVISIAADFQSLEWRLGGNVGSLGLAPEDRPLGQHYVSEPASGRVLVFDNGYERAGVRFSRAIEYQLDLANDTATKVWEYRHVPEIYAALVGSARRLPNGNTAVLFGMFAGHNASTGPITAVEVTPAGVVVWRLTFGNQLSRLYRVTPVASLLGEEVGAFEGR